MRLTYNEFVKENFDEEEEAQRIINAVEWDDWILKGGANPY